MVFDKENWPEKLNAIFKQKKINTVIYVGAVNGYLSGQELFRLLRDGLSINPDVHISYSGANEGGANYISDYGWDFYETGFRQTSTSPLLPSTVYLLKKKLQFSYSDLSLTKFSQLPSFDFWQQNMMAMKGIATGKGYSFIGILQPVLGVGVYRYQNEEPDKEEDKEHNAYYPQAQKYIHEQDSSLYDFTATFDTINGRVYKDGCHLNKEYQPIIAKKVFTLLRERKLL